MPEQVPLRDIGQNCARLVERLLGDAAGYGFSCHGGGEQARVLLFGRDAPHAHEAGALLASLCQGGLCDASVYTDAFGKRTLPFIRCATRAPRLATLTLQSATSFAGVMLSGPVKLFIKPSPDVLYGAKPVRGALTALLQADSIPSNDWIDLLAERIGCKAQELTLLVAPQESVAGATQIAGRMNENVCFTMERSLGLNARLVRRLEGYAPVCPPGSATRGGKRLLPDDYLHYGAFARVYLDAETDGAQLARALTFEALPQFGTLFSDLLEQAGGDFFRIPDIEHINRLARIEVVDAAGMNTYCAGSARPELLI